MLFGPPTANPPPSSSWAMLLQITEFGAHTSNPFADHHLPPKSKATLSRLTARKLQPTKCKWPLVTALNTSRPCDSAYHTTKSRLESTIAELQQQIKDLHNLHTGAKDHPA